MGYAILGLCLLSGGYLLLRWYVTADPKLAAKLLRWLLIGLAAALCFYLAVAGRHGLAAFTALALPPMFLLSRRLWQRMKSAAGPTPGQVSEIKTRFLHMELDHDSGAMRGRVLDGAFRGRELSELDLNQLLTLWRFCLAGDEQSAQVLEAYLDRTQGEAWREAASADDGDGRPGPGAGAGRVMTREEAYEILGLEPGAGGDAIRDAHRRLMQHMHPDRGGSNYLAAKINQAKDLLLGL